MSRFSARLVRRGQQGFTLIEILLASVLLVSLFVVIFGRIASLLEELDTVTTMAKQGREAPAIMGIIEKDLVNAFADPRMEEVFSAEDSRGGTELRFVTSRNSILFLDGVQSDVTEVGYKVERNKQPGSRELYTLYRREDFLMDDEPTEGGLWIPVADNIVEFRCTFFDLPDLDQVDDRELFEMKLGGGADSVSEELDSWDSEDRYLPYAVKIILTVDIREANVREDEDTEAAGLQTLVSYVRLPPFSRNLPESDDEDELQLNVAPPNEGEDNGNNGGNNNAGNNAGSGNGN